MRLTAQGVMNALTLSRLLLTALLWVAIGQGLWQTITVLLVVIVADVLDGVIARGLGVDGVQRRFLDAAVDRFSIHSAYAVALWTHPQYLGWYWPLLTRDLLIITGYFAFVRPSHQIITGSAWHKWSNCTLAVLALLVVADIPVAVMLAAPFVIIVGYVLLADYIGVLLAFRQRQIPQSWCSEGVIRAPRLQGIQKLFGSL